MRGKTTFKAELGDTEEGLSRFISCAHQSFRHIFIQQKTCNSLGARKGGKNEYLISTILSNIDISITHILFSVL